MKDLDKIKQVISHVHEPKTSMLSVIFDDTAHSILYPGVHGCEAFRTTLAPSLAELAQVLQPTKPSSPDRRTGEHLGSDSLQMGVDLSCPQCTATGGEGKVEILWPLLQDDIPGLTRCGRTPGRAKCKKKRALECL